MPWYRLIYQQRNTTETVTLDVFGNRACHARDEGRNNMNARGHDPIQWPLCAQTLLETT